MNRVRMLGTLSAVIFGLISLSSQATLMSRLGGAAAYDTVLDITWLTDADLSGFNDWDGQVAWAESLNISSHLGFNSGWRLASMDVNDDDTVVSCSGALEPACRDNELGYMFYHNMGGSFSDNLSGNQLVDGVLLTDIQSFYWSGTEFAPNPFNAWLFNFGNGIQGSFGKDVSIYGWAVRSGDVAATVPEPSVLGLFAIGLFGLLGVKAHQRRL